MGKSPRKRDRPPGTSIDWVLGIVVTIIVVLAALLCGSLLSAWWSG